MRRREFVTKGSAFIGLVGSSGFNLSSEAFRIDDPQAAPTESRLERVTQHVSVYHDTVNVGVIQSNNHTLLIDLGGASILKHATALGVSAVTQVLFTHYHRDQCCGASQLKSVNIGVPASEASLFTSATDFWLDVDRILDHRYTFRPELMVLRESVDVHQQLSGGDIVHWEGLSIRTLATPGHTDGSLSYFIEIDGEVIAFTGDLIYGAGQLWEFYSLQKRFPGLSSDYFGFGGAVPELLESSSAVIAQRPTIVIPSHGEVIRQPHDALTLFQERLKEVMRSYFTLCPWRVSQRKDPPSLFNVPLFPSLPPVPSPSWMHRIEGTTSSYIQAEDGAIFLFDAGQNPVMGELSKLVESGAIHRIDGIWPSHYHDDHTSCINLVLEQFGGQVYAQKEMVDILENPTAYSMPCLFPESIHVDHVLEEGETFHWKGYEITGYYFPGQTLYHEGLLIQHDGYQLFMCGDSFANWAIGDVCIQNRNFVGKDGEEAGIIRCLKLLQRLKPDLLYAAHWGPLPISQEYIKETIGLLEKREKMFAELFPWDDPNFGLDPCWVRAYPYRQNIVAGQKVTIDACIFNHSDKSRIASVELRVPSGWQVDSANSLTIPGHSEGRLRLTAMAPEHPLARREVLGLSLLFGDYRLDEFTEAIVDYYEPN